ncbi:MAG: hypothetical protein AVDCRST_MAG01-01-426, partial [uncultured Rubrobacteraceae bacterium]
VATRARPGPDPPRGPSPRRTRRASKGTISTFLRRVLRTAGGVRAGGDVGGGGGAGGLVRTCALPFGVFAAANPEL